MKKINQGEYEVLTTKEDAIDKFMQMQGVCREKISEENRIQFYCSKKGKIVITNPPRGNSTSRLLNTNSTNLYAEVREKDDKTYITFYTAFNKFNNVIKLIFLTMNIIIAIFAIVSADKTASPIILLLCLAFFVFVLYNASNEKNNSPTDSEILIKELEKRINAVNLWDK